MSFALITDYRFAWFPTAAPKTVEFDFDLGADTAMSVATEMVNELSLSHEDACSIAGAIGEEIRQLTGKLVSNIRDDNESLLSSDSAVVAVHSQPPANNRSVAMDCDPPARVPSPAEPEPEEGTFLVGSKGSDRGSMSRIQHVHFHEQDAASPNQRTQVSRNNSASFRDALASMSPYSQSSVAEAAAKTADESPALSNHSRSGVDLLEAGQGAVRPASASGTEMLLLDGSLPSASSGDATGVDAGSEQTSLVGIKRSGSGILSPTTDSQKVPLKCALPPHICNVVAHPSRSK